MNSSYYIGISHNITQDPDLDVFKTHTHDCYELFYFISGNATYYIEGTKYALSNGDILILKKAEAHALRISSHVPFERIVLHFDLNALVDINKEDLITFLDSRPLGKQNLYPASIYKDSKWLYYLNQIIEAKINPKRRLYLTILITELSLSASHNFDYREANDSITDIIHYINDHLTQPLNIHTLCKKFFISKQHLYRKFENATGSTVWRYIVTKRLLLARELIVNGVAANEACVKSGFNDYSTFYKSYRAQFGHSPKDDLVSKKDD